MRKGKIRLVFEKIHFIKAGYENRYLISFKHSFRALFFQRDLPLKITEWSNAEFSMNKIVNSVISYLADKGWKCQKISRSWWSIKELDGRIQRNRIGFSLFFKK